MGQARKTKQERNEFTQQEYLPFQTAWIESRVVKIMAFLGKGLGKMAPNVRPLGPGFFWRPGGGTRPGPTQGGTRPRGGGSRET